jgi:hypothetical protein
VIACNGRQCAGPLFGLGLELEPMLQKLLRCFITQHMVAWLVKDSVLRIATLWWKDCVEATMRNFAECRRINSIFM